MRSLPPTPLRLVCLALALWAALFPALGAFASAHVAVDALDRGLPSAHWTQDHTAHHAHVHADADHGDDSWDGFVHLLAHELSSCAQSFAPSPLLPSAPALLAPAAPLPAAIARAPSPRLESLLRPPIG
ncbi:hypothetical protein [Aquimonas voraii]|uniref:Cobalt transporter subunit CbtB n=1 Tax=Aquimonas voraii TaxID=265719 RepID=A0A1G6VGW0_9GAMM|nr:hypothetical protein [Aquimonas voraii]SDD52076.1 hypothetical protein SAMN04488509_10344 [Aquimonas voraii]